MNFYAPYSKPQHSYDLKPQYDCHVKLFKLYQQIAAFKAASEGLKI